MTDRLEKAIRNGKQAAVLLDDPLLKEALDMIEAQAIEAMTTCAADELLENRERVNGVRFVRRALRAYFDNGKIAQRSLTTN